MKTLIRIFGLTLCLVAQLFASDLGEEGPTRKHLALLPKNASGVFVIAQEILDEEGNLNPQYVSVLKAFLSQYSLNTSLFGDLPVSRGHKRSNSERDTVLRSLGERPSALVIGGRRASIVFQSPAKKSPQQDPRITEIKEDASEETVVVSPNFRRWRGIRWDGMPGPGVSAK